MPSACDGSPTAAEPATTLRRPAPGSRSSRACRAPAVPRRRTAWRTSATSWSTTCRPRCCRRWRSSHRARAGPPGSRSWSTLAAGCSSASCRRRSRSCGLTGRVPDRVPGGGRPGPGQPVRGHAPPASAGARRPRRRGHPQGTADDGEPSWRRRPGDRHVRASPRTSCASGSATPSPTRRPRHGLQVSLISFGFKYGAPRDADLMLDVRFLPNPYWVDELRPLTGTGRAGCEYVRDQPQYREFIERLEALIELDRARVHGRGEVVPDDRLGCTGGRHRSVVVAEELALVLPRAGTAGRGRRIATSSAADAAGVPAPSTAGTTRRTRWLGWSPAATEEDSMTIKIGVNGFGRIGRNFFRAAKSSGAPTSTSWPSTTSPTPRRSPTC